MEQGVLQEDGWSEALRAAHLALSVEDLRFRELARRDPDLRRRSTFRALDGDPRLRYRQQPWPVFVGRAKLDELKRVSLALASLIRSVPRRIFGGDTARIAEFYDLPSREAADIVLSEPSGLEDSLARADLIDTAAGFKCMEFNFTADLGGWETSLLAELHGRVPETTRICAREGIRFTYTSTLRVLFGQVILQAQRLGICERGELNVACVFDAARLSEPGTGDVVALCQRELGESFREAACGLRGKVAACRYGDLIPVQGKLFCRKMQVHVVFELCLGHAPAGVYRLFKAGKLLLFNGPIDDVLSEKRNLALLSENDGSSAFSTAEQEVIRANIPWTRLLLAKPVRFRGEEVFLPDLLAGAREQLVLKEGRNFGGQGVFLGRSISAARWEELVQSALAAGGWVVQEHLESLPYLFQCGEDGCAPHDVIWGPFVFGSTYGGVILRVQPQAMGGSINASQTATEGVVFEV